jgi:hypothetical protein
VQALSRPPALVLRPVLYRLKVAVRLVVRLAEQEREREQQV